MESDRLQSKTELYHASTMLTNIVYLPKVVLHDHLDGGLRASTLIDLADRIGYQELPESDTGKLTQWIHCNANRKDMRLTLEMFAHTVAVMQTQDSIARVARECAEDLASDGVVYAEVRFAPELHCAQGLVMDDAIEAVLDGFQQGSKDTPLTIRTICAAIRNFDQSLEVAQATARWKDNGVVAIDLAGPELGYPPEIHLDALRYCQREGVHITLHAGEVAEPDSIHKALRVCGANRIGHGIRIMDDITIDEDGEYTLGDLAMEMLERQIHFEMCPTSNICIGEIHNMAEHPIQHMLNMGFNVSLNTDNRLMFGVSMSSEWHALGKAFEYTQSTMRDLTINAIQASFLEQPIKQHILETQIEPAYRSSASRSQG